jgi:hypothetical protein
MWLASQIETRNKGIPIKFTRSAGNEFRSMSFVGLNRLMAEYPIAHPTGSKSRAFRLYLLEIQSWC